MQARSKAFWAGACRGVKFGAIASATIWLILDVVCVGLVVTIPKLREKAIDELMNQSALSAIGGFVAPLLLMVVYGALPGAIIMGIAGMLRPRRDESPESN